MQTWGTVILSAFALFVALGCTFEYYRIAEKHGAHPIKPLGYAFSTITIMVWAGNQLYDGYVFGVDALGWILQLSLVITLAVQLWRKTENPFADVLHTLLPMFYAATPLSMMPYLHYSMNVLVMCIIIRLWNKPRGQWPAPMWRLPMGWPHGLLLQRWY